MGRPHVTQLRIQGFNCIHDATIALTPLHALIDPNDNRKTTVLRALRTLSRYTQQRNPQATMSEFSLYEHKTTTLETHVESTDVAIVQRDRDGQSEHHVDDETHSALNGQHTLHFEPESLRQASALIPEDAPLRFTNERDLGLPTVYDAILSHDVTTYLTLNKRLAKSFPTVKSISLKNTHQQTKSLDVQLEDSAFITATAMSEKLLRFLTFAAIPYLTPAALLLVEEPENGLHSARIRDVIAMLREISKSTQVIVATHSPFVVKELEPDEMTLLGRDTEKGTKTATLTDNVLENARTKALALRK